MRLDKIPWMTWLLGATTLLIAGLRLEPYLQLTAVANEPWRLWTGHFTHWNVDHLVWDFIVFVALGSFCELHHRRAFLILVLMGALALSVPLLALSPIYRGLSGLDSGLFVLTLCLLAETAFRRGNVSMLSILFLAAAAFLGKSLFEAATDHTLFVDSRSAEFVPLVSAHLLGACAGVAAFVAGRWRIRLRGSLRDDFGQRN